MKNQYIFLLMTMVLISFASAEVVFRGKQGDTITLIQGCEQSTYSNISQILFPNLTIVQGETAMIPIGTIYNYNFTKTNAVGIYTIVGHCDEGGVDTQWGKDGSYQIEITQDGKITSLPQTIFYIFFLLIVSTMLIFSIRITVNNPYSNDVLSESKRYEMSKNNKFQFYLNMMKKKLWIVGVFGIYLSLMIFSALATEVSLLLGMQSLNGMFSTTFIILSWLSIPFVVFWLAYVVLYLTKGSAEMLKYSFGGFRRNE